MPVFTPKVFASTLAPYFALPGFPRSLDYAALREKGIAATRQLAKRQMTWFRNQMDESWKRMEP